MTDNFSTKNIRALILTVALGIASVTFLFVATSGFGRTTEQPRPFEGATRSEVSASVSEPRPSALSRVPNTGRGAVSAIGGKAVSVSEGPQGLTANDLIVSKPVFKAFALSSDGKRLLYSPLKRGIPSGEIWIEDLVTGTSRRIASRLVLNASFSPVDDSKIAYTFADNGSFGLAVIDLSSGASRTLVPANVFAVEFQWDDSGTGVHYFETIIETSTDELFDDASANTLFRKHVLWNSPDSLPDNYERLGLLKRFAATEPGLDAPTAPLEFPQLDTRALFDIRAISRGKADPASQRYQFRRRVSGGDIELIGENLLGPGRLLLRDKRTGSTRELGIGQIEKLLGGGAIIRETTANQTVQRLVTWDGAEQVLGTMQVNFQLPVSTSTMTQGGAGYSSPGNCAITAHYSHLEFAYDFQRQVVGTHVMASAPGLVVFTVGSVTCNSGPATCPDSVPGGCPGGFLGNVVVIQHADGTYSKYAHMETNSPQAVVGTAVDQGLYIGRQGHTGSTDGSFNNCGDHLHFQRQVSPDIYGQSIPVDFAEVVSEPLSCGTVYTSASTEISHSLSPSSQNFGIAGGNGVVQVTSTGGSWTASSGNSWIVITNSGSGTGNDAVTYQVADNSAGGPRTGTLTIGGHIFTVNQDGSQPANVAPAVNAGPDQAITLPAAVNLNGTASDDGLPNPPASLTTTWSKISGPGNVTFTNPNSPAGSATIDMAGVYVLRLTADDGGIVVYDDVRVVANVVSAGGLLSGSRAGSPSSANLSTGGTADWAHWGLTSASSFDHKQGVTQQISDYTYLGNASALRYTGDATTFSWSDGTPTSSASTNSGIFTYGVGNGFLLTVPADTTSRTLKLHVGLWSAGARLEVVMSDGSASPYVDALENTAAVSDVVYTLDYKAASSGQNLILRWTIENSYHPIGNITLKAATLAVQGSVNQAPLVNAGSDQTVAISSGASLAGSATDDGLPNPPATLTYSWSVVSGPGTVTFGNAAQPVTTASFSSLGTYVLRLTANDGAVSGTDDVTVAVSSTTPGTLSVNSASMPTGALDLSTEGTTDWAHWGLSGTSFNHKAGVTSRINNFTQIGNGELGQFTGNSTLYAWTDGTPAASASNVSAGVWANGLNNGYQVTVAADTVPRTLKMYVGLWAAGGRFEASLSDGSAPVYIDTSQVNSTATTNLVYTLNYQAASAGQTLTVKWTANQVFNQWSNLTLQAATLSGGTGTPVNQAPVVNAGADLTATVQVPVSLSGTANDDGLPTPPGVLTTNWSLVSGPGTVNFADATSPNTTADFSAAGTYILRLTAFDGALTSSDDLTITVNPAGQGSLLVTSGPMPTGALDLSAEGTTDWAHWGLSGTSFNHKAGVTSQISNFTQIGNRQAQQFTNNPTLYAWTGGTPTASASNVSTGLWMRGLNNGYQVTVAADTIPRTLKMYVGLWAAGGRFEASLSDGSAPVYIDTQVNSTATTNLVYTLNYQAASAGQTLAVKWTSNQVFNNWSNLTLQAATLY